MRITIQGRKPKPGTAYMVVRSGGPGELDVFCVCADPATARKHARKYNRENPEPYEDYRARVEVIAFYPTAH